MPGSGHRHGRALPVGFSTPPHSSVQGCSPTDLESRFRGASQVRQLGCPLTRGSEGPLWTRSCMLRNPAPALALARSSEKACRERLAPHRGAPAATPAKSAAHAEPQQPAFRKPSAAHSTALWIKFKAWKNKILCNTVVSDQTDYLFAFCIYFHHLPHSGDREQRMEAAMKPQGQGQGRAGPGAKAGDALMPPPSPAKRAAGRMPVHSPGPASRSAGSPRSSEQRTLCSQMIFIKPQIRRVGALSPGAQDSHQQSN